VLILKISKMKNYQLRNMKLQNLPKQQGAVLLEAMIAILIFSFGILAISGLQGAMMKNTVDAAYRAEASYIVQQRMGEMLVNPVGLGASKDVPIDSLPGGKLSITPVTEGRLQLVVTWQVPGEAQHNYQATTSIFMARDPI
jgi:type IV pilus assembly protein PilV